MQADKAGEVSELWEAFCGMLRSVVRDEKALMMMARFRDSDASLSNAVIGLGAGEFANAFGLGNTYDPARQCKRSRAYTVNWVPSSD